MHHLTFSQLSKRFERREEAKEEGEEAKETGTAEDVDRLSRRTVKVTKEHNEECRRLLKLMGIPVIVVCLSMCSIAQLLKPSQAPSEAEAQCAELARGGKVCDASFRRRWYSPKFRYMQQVQKIWTPSPSTHPFSTGT
jgi:5'-3' exonuclease